MTDPLTVEKARYVSHARLGALIGRVVLFVVGVVAVLALAWVEVGR